MTRLASFVCVGHAALLVAEVELMREGALRQLWLLEKFGATAFDIIFITEVACGLWALGARRYFRAFNHCYAAGVCAATVVADLVLWVYAAPYQRGGFPSADVLYHLHVALTLRAFRLLRLLASFERLKKLKKSTLKLLPAFGGLGGALWALSMLYAQVGIATFGGLVTNSTLPSNAPPQYELCNFNDFAGAMLTLFALLVVNNWCVGSRPPAKRTPTRRAQPAPTLQVDALRSIPLACRSRGRPRR